MQFSSEFGRIPSEIRRITADGLGGADAPPSGPGRGFGAAAPEAKEQLSTLPCCATRVAPSNGPFLGAWIDAKFGLLLCWYDSPFLGAWRDAKFGLSPSARQSIFGRLG